jgi:glycosyltransferase involved in cell wall biosynthesis
VPHAELPVLLNSSELFVLPSHFEGSPKALLEAMACGVPVLGAASPGIREVLIHRHSGFLCGPSPAEIRSALVELFSDAPLRARLREGGVRYVEEHCSLTIAAQRERALLRELLPA